MLKWSMPVDSRTGGCARVCVRVCVISIKRRIRTPGEGFPHFFEDLFKSQWPCYAFRPGTLGGSVAASESEAMLALRGLVLCRAFEGLWRAGVYVRWCRAAPFAGL